YTGYIENGTLKGDLIIQGSGDPTLGSWRYEDTREDTVLNEFEGAIHAQGIHTLTGNIYAPEQWPGERLPGGWIWEDIGNYYGAGAGQLNWRENQYDLILKSGTRIGDSVVLESTIPSELVGLDMKVLATSAAAGTGDQTVIYVPLFGKNSHLRGTIPVDEDHFAVSGSMPHPGMQMAITLQSMITRQPMQEIASKYPETWSHSKIHDFYSHTSPDLDSITYWFLKRSINLFGEALTKTLGGAFTGSASTDSGVAVIQRHWNRLGISPYAMNIQDGCGLSPANRVTASTLVKVMQYARKRPWFSSFYYALPEIHGIKMKSGSIGGVVSYTGYIPSKDGTLYTFAFIINNFYGNSDAIRKKMWNLLDILK
ncbi:MAG: D-alanyl-D-alanine carboxypeptidase, partial [Bacteroidota bacterium]|nr:D-alanyl-D-alanine carboxypeptidase [Bacteroidota bacterium]